MKCPHCGMNIRDEITECGYCGGKISRRPAKAAAGAGKFTVDKNVQKAAQHTKTSDDPDSEDEEEGGLSKILQPGEQVLIGSLNVTVKKFFFHAYLTNQRIFLIDTQEKKLKVTAKDVARDTIAGSIVEFSENSDPVLVLSIKSGEEDTKTMKLVFVQSGTDRSSEIDEWLSLLHDEDEPIKKAPKRPAPASRKPAEPEEPEEDEEVGEAEEEAEEPVAARPPERPRQRQELRPAKKSLKDHERQPPVKRLLSLYNVQEEEPEPEPEPEPVAVPPRKMHIRQVVASSYEREIPPAEKPEVPPVRKPEVQSAMKGAMKGAIRQAGPQSQQPMRRPVVESPPRYVPEEPEREPESARPRRPIVQENIEEKPIAEEVAGSPQFCHNCGKKLPHSANFCPGCGTKLNQSRTLPHSRTAPSAASRKATRTDPPGHEHKAAVPDDMDDDDVEDVKPVPTRPPVKKAPKGSEMTILHKFLRR
ncbi:MAG: zinc ribbon domain-containing protein [Methanoregula sp.]|nr:zinc ribbon domain-containing protein [Methanoregula sp.]